MLLLGTLALEIFIFLLYLPHAFLYWPLFAVLVYGVLWYHLDDSEATGDKSWAALRRWSLWRDGLTAVKYFWGNQETLFDTMGRKPVLFVVVGNVTNMALISGFGFHGGIFDNFDLRYLLPWPVFRVPLLREVLMWSGAVADGPDAILSLLRRGKSVCYALNGMRAVLKAEQEDDDEFGEELYEFVKTENITVVPVLVTGEHERYSISTYSFNSYFLDLTGWPFPFLFGPRIFGNDAPPKLKVEVQVPMAASEAGTYKEFNAQFFIQIRGGE
jgi:hypothetical protein